VGIYDVTEPNFSKATRVQLSAQKAWRERGVEVLAVNSISRAAITAQRRADVNALVRVW
jgi:hypothetical protein